MKSSGSRSLDVVSIGGATLDIFAHLDAARGEHAPFSFSAGEKVALERVLERFGGGAANTAVGFARLGFRTGVLTIVGDDVWGQRILANLKREGVDVDGVSVIQEEVSSFSVILLAQSGERVVLHSPGVAGHLCDPLFDRDVVRRASWVILTRLASEGCRILDDLLVLFEADSPPSLLWNPGGSQVREGLRSPLLQRLVEHTAILHVNEEELLRFTDTDDLVAGLRKLRDRGIGTICVTRGSEGAVAVSGAEAWRAQALPTTLVDTTGAGDAFAVGFSAARMRGEDLRTALVAGSVASASVIATVGTQPGLLTNTEMRIRLQATTLPIDPFPLS